MMAHTTTLTTQPATTPATLEDESSLSVGALVAVSITVLLDRVTVLVAKELSLLGSGPVDGLISEGVSLTKHTVT